MPNDILVKTEFLFDGRSTSRFTGHPDIALEGMSKINSSPEAWSPPHMLVAAAESCVFLTMLAAAEKMRIKITGYSSTAEGMLTSPDGRHKELSEIVVKPKFVFADEADRSRIPQLLKIADEYCYVGRSLKTPVRIEADTAP